MSSQRGMSLVEVVVAVSLFGAVISVVGPVLISAFRATGVVQNESRAIDEIRIAVARIDRELRSAECISSPASGQLGSTLTFRTRAGTGSAYDVTYAVSGGGLVRTTAAGTQRVGEGVVVSGQEFAHTGNPGQRAQVVIALQMRFEAANAPRSVGTTITGRNAWKACP